MVAGTQDAWTRFTTRLMRSGERTARTDIEIGGVYLFAYDPSPREVGDFMPEDMLPLFILTRFNGRGITGINVKGVENRSTRLRMLEYYEKAMASTDLTERLRGLYLISRTVQTQKPLRKAYKFFRWQRIRGKVVKVTPEEFREMIEKVM